MTTQQINVPASNPLEANRKLKSLENLATLSAENLDKLVSLKNSKKGLDYLQNKWFMLQSFLGI